MSDGLTTCQREHPDFCGQITWQNLAWPLIWWPIICQTVMALVIMPMLRMFWLIGSFRRSPLINQIQRIVGMSQDPKSGNRIALVVVWGVEVSMSFWFALAWIHESYTREVEDWLLNVEMAFCIIFVMIYFIDGARSQFNFYYAFYPGSIITVFTAFPTFWRHKKGKGSERWFSWGYLRIYNAIVGYTNMEHLALFTDFSELQRMYLLTFLQLIVFVVVCSGTTFNFEILGEIPSVVTHPQHITTDMGEISFFQMVYWTFTTLSTVGYGDFSPTTAPSRLFFIFVSVTGVVLFSIKAAEVVEQHRLQTTGRGRYQNGKFNLWHYLCARSARSHVVIVGGGVPAMSSLIEPFLRELYSESTRQGEKRWPDVSFLCNEEQPRRLRDLISAMPTLAQSRIQYFVGDPMDFDDTERLRVAESSLVIVLPNYEALDTDTEDHSNIVQALAISNAYPEVNIRLTLLRPQNQKKAVWAGIPPNRCFSLSEVKSALFAHSCSCRGWNSMILNLMTTDAEHEDIDPYADRWFVEYRNGRSAHISGFHIAARFVGFTFLKFVQELALHGIMPIAVQINGKLILNPSWHELQERDVVFAMVPNSKSLQGVRDTKSSNWGEYFLEQQRDDTDRFLTNVTLHHDASKQRIEKAKTQESLTNQQSQIGSFMTNYAPSENLPHSDRAAAFAKMGGHYIMVVLAGNPWQQISAFLDVIDWAHSHNHTGVSMQIPVLVLVAKQLKEVEHASHMTEAHDNVAIKFLGADKPTIHDVKHAGLFAARAVVLVAGNADHDGVYNADGIGVMLLAGIEYELNQEGCPGIPVILELNSQESIRALRRFPPGVPDPSRHHIAAKKYPPTHFTSHPRFASGCVFAGNCLGALLARVYYTPGIMELLLPLVLGVSAGHDHFRVQPWQLSVPGGCEEKTYGELVQFLLTQPGQPLCLGLYRRIHADMEGGNEVRYLVTNPPPSDDVRAHDLIIALGNLEFGQWCYESGLIATPKTPKGEAATSEINPTFDWNMFNCNLEKTEAEI